MANETIVYSSIVIKADRCSETLYSIYFNPQICDVDPKGLTKALQDALDKATLASHGALSFDVKDLDCGVISMRQNPLIESSEYEILDLFDEVSRIVREHTTL